MKSLIVKTLEVLSGIFVIAIWIVGFLVGGRVGDLAGAIIGLVIAFVISVVVFGALFVFLEMNQHLREIVKLLGQREAFNETGSQSLSSR